MKQKNFSPFTQIKTKLFLLQIIKTNNVKAEVIQFALEQDLH